MRRELEEDIIDAIIKSDGPGARKPCGPNCAPLLDQPWPGWVPALARQTPEGALGMLGSGWSGLAPAHAMEHLRHLGLNRVEGPRTPAEVFVIRGRDGASWLPAELLAPGDLILLSRGETVPADVRLLRVHRFRVDEGTLTGAPGPVPKAPDWEGGGPVPLTAIPDLCFAGTRVVEGTATAMVVATGRRTWSALHRAS